MTRRMLLVLVVAAVVACGHRPLAPAEPAGPPIELHLPALDGGTLDLASLRGQVVVLHVFSTWSLAAQGEVDALRAADQRPDVTVVGLALDPEGRTMVAPWRKASDVHYLVVLADDTVRSGHSVLGRLAVVPTTIVLDRAGRIHGRAERQLAPAELDAMIAAARAAT